MKVSYSGQSEESGVRNQESGRHRVAPRPTIIVVAAYVVVHVALLAPSLEDIDSINFALGLRHFDVANHQPHPPGYPVYIALGRASLAVIRAAAPAIDPARAEAMALAVWSALGGAAALLAAWALFAEVGRYRSKPSAFFKVGGISFSATLLLAVSPLFWISGLRPLSDMPGLALAMISQALALRGTRDRTSLVIAAAIAGLAAGVRVQSVCLTLPILAFAMWHQRAAGVWWLISRPLVAMVVAGFAWALPLVMLSGGVDGYLRALGTQAGEDFAWVGMLWTNPTPRRLAFALWETFALPWDNVVLATGIGAAAALGAIASLVNDRRAFGVVALAFAPYLLFHLLLQETIFVRYALPTIPLMAWLAVRGIGTLGRAAPYVVHGMVVASIIVGVPAGWAYSRQSHPAFAAIAEMSARATTAPPAAIYSHYSLRRPLQASSPGGVRIVEPRRSYEWLGLVDYWRRGETAPVWFLADALRTDLALIDPRSRTGVRHFVWRVADRATLSGARPTRVDWYVLDPPGWFAGEGWGLTPETGGLSQATRMGVDHRPIEAWVRRRSGPMRIMVGGRHFSDPGTPPVVLTVTIDDAVVTTWRVDPAPGGFSFLRFVDLPSGLPPGEGPYAHLAISARAEPATQPTPAIAIRQFDLQPSDTLMYGFGNGWHEAEYETATGLHWRWTSGKSVLQVVPPQSVAITLRGESPLKYFDAPPTVRLTAAGEVIGEVHPDADFTWRVIVPDAAVRRAEGAIAVEVDRVYLPGQAEGTSDPRRLGLRVFDTAVTPVAPPGTP